APPELPSRHFPRRAPAARPGLSPALPGPRQTSRRPPCRRLLASSPQIPHCAPCSRHLLLAATPAAKKDLQESRRRIQQADASNQRRYGCRRHKVGRTFDRRRGSLNRAEDRWNLRAQQLDQPPKRKGDGNEKGQQQYVKKRDENDREIAQGR